MKQLILITVVLSIAQLSSAQTIALTGATIIDGNGGNPIHDGVVIVKGPRIEAVGPRSTVAVPSDARVIDVKGKYSVPGIIDGNVHLIPWPSWTYIEFLAR